MGLAPVNTIIIVESLNNLEKRTGKELYDEVIVRYTEYYKAIFNQPLITRYFSISSKVDLLNLLKNLADESTNYPLGILVHIETHGSDDLQGLVLSNGDFVNWKEVQDLLRRINVETNNQFYLSMATCYGVYVHKTMDHNKPAPFCAFISALEKISPDEIIDNFEPYFKELVRTRDAVSAYKNSKSESSKFFYKDSEEVYKLIVREIKQLYDTDISYRKNFIDLVRHDFKEQFPGKYFNDDQIDHLFKIAFNQQIGKIREIFLFGRGR